MAYDFPNSPTVGQSVTFDDGTKRVWDGVKWVAGTSGSGASGGGPYLPVSGGTMTGRLILVGDPTQNLEPVTKQYLTANAVTSNSPALTGTPTAPTASIDANTTQIATTQFVLNQAADVLPLMDDPVAVIGSSTRFARADHVHPSDTALLALTGGTMTGPLTLAANPSDNLDAATKQYVDAQIAAGGTYVDAPKDGDTYGRMDGTWMAVLPITGGTLTGPLTLARDPTGAMDAVTMAYVQVHYAPTDSPAFTGVPTTPTASVDTSNTQIATTEFVLNQAATTSPAMDAVAAIGSSTRYARADHVHPTDTSLLPVAGGTLTGPLTLAADPATNLQAATKQYIDSKFPLNYSQLPQEVQQLPLAFSIAGQPSAGGMLLLTMAMKVTIPANLAGTVFSCWTPAGAPATFLLNRVVGGSTTQIGQIDVQTNSISGTGATLNVGDTLQLVFPATQDASLADMCITILAWRV